MKKHISIVLGMSLLPVFAMAAPSFSGSWVQDTAKSERVPDPMWLTRPPAAGRGGAGGGGGRAGGPGARGPAAEVVMTVQQDANGLQVTEPSGMIRKYSLDGKPSTVAMETDMGKATVAASLQGDMLVIATTRPYGGMPGNVTLQVKEVWSLSPDGKTLTITTTHTSPATEKAFKQIYNRK